VFLLLATVALGGAAPLRIVASFLPLYATTKTIVGDRAEVFQLARAGVGPHEFAPKPSDLKTLSTADLLVVNGVGLEEWLDKTVKEVGSPRLVVVNASAGIAARANPATLPVPDGVKSDDEGETGANPHVWLDPVLEKKQAENILAAVRKADPANADYYTANERAYVAKLDALDADFRTLFASVKDTNLITFHDAFPYFAARYHLHYLGSIEEFPEKAPSPRALAHIVDLIKADHVKVLFAEEGYEPKLLRSLAAQTGAVVSEIDTLEVGEPDADAYLTRMRANLDALKKAWQ
jgi:ABC-type Zn uptake system ZnuABC Zn-binding protein ZnuA